jgi:pSer/pThr/pTyr-binding forkhead associated (FHA) protein/tetratricopeptide (TPR) repeat protein
MFTLKVFRGDKVVQELDLDGPEIKIGRSPDNQVALADDGKGVSRVHAVIRLEDGNYVLSDANSRNGTYVDGKPIKRMVIQPGQDFVIGPYRLVFGSGEYSGSMPTMVASRDEGGVLPPPQPVEAGTAQGAGRGGTSRGGAGQTKGADGSTKSRPAATGKTTPGGGLAGRKPGMSTTYIAIGAIAAIVVLGVVIWALLPGGGTQITQVSTTTIPTTIPETTTSIPETTTTIDPHSEQMTLAMQAVEAAEAVLGEKRARQARTEFNRIIKEYITPILAADPQYQPAIDLEARVRQGIATSEGLIPTTTSVPPITPGPNDVTPRANETPAAWKERNALAHQDYAMGVRLYNQGEFTDALKVLNELAAREPGWRDVSTYVRNAQEGLYKARSAAMNDALGPEGEGHKLMLARRFPEAAAALLSARKLWERAVGLQAPGADKYLADNLERRRRVAKESLELAYTHLNRRNTAEAVKYLQLVISLLPPGEPLHDEAQKTLVKVKAAEN